MRDANESVLRAAELRRATGAYGRATVNHASPQGRRSRRAGQARDPPTRYALGRSRGLLRIPDARTELHKLEAESDGSHSTRTRAEPSCTWISRDGSGDEHDRLRATDGDAERRRPVARVLGRRSRTGGALRGGEARRGRFVSKGRAAAPVRSVDGAARRLGSGAALTWSALALPRPSGRARA